MAALDTAAAAVSGLVGTWPLGIASGTDVPDGGTSGDATIHDGAVTYQQGALGCGEVGIHLATTMDGPSLGTTAHTLIFWCQADNNGSGYLSTNGGTTNIVFGSGDVDIQTGSGFFNPASPVPIPTDHPACYAQTFDGVNAHELYLDAVSIVTGTGGPGGSPGRWSLCGYWTGSAQGPIAGTYFRVLLYDRVLSQPEIQSLHDAALDPPAGVRFYGTSITNGQGASDGAHAYTGVVDAALSLTHSGQGYSGQDACSIAGTLLGTPNTHANKAGDITGLEMLYNSMRFSGDNPAFIAVSMDAVRSACVWWSVDHAQVLSGSDGRVTRSGTDWTTGYTFNNFGQDAYTTTDGATLDATVDGTAVYVCHLAGNPSVADQLGSYTVTIDGVDYGPFSTAAASVSAIQTFWPATTRIGGLASGSHAVRVATHNDQGGTRYVHIMFLAGSGMAAGGVPLMDCPPMTAAGYAADAPYNQGSDAAVAAYNAAAVAVLAELHGDGLPDVRWDLTGYDPATLTGPDDIHMNDDGHAFLAARFLAALNPPAGGDEMPKLTLAAAGNALAANTSLIGAPVVFDVDATTPHEGAALTLALTGNAVSAQNQGTPVHVAIYETRTTSPAVIPSLVGFDLTPGAGLAQFGIVPGTTRPYNLARLPSGYYRIVLTYDGTHGAVTASAAAALLD